jgi:hypothetical protein
VAEVSGIMLSKPKLSHGASRRDGGGREEAVIIAEISCGLSLKCSPKGSQPGAAWPAPEVQIRRRFHPVPEASDIAEEVSTGAQVESYCKRVRSKPVPQRPTCVAKPMAVSDSSFALRGGELEDD